MILLCMSILLSQQGIQGLDENEMSGSLVPE